MKGLHLSSACFGGMSLLLHYPSAAGILVLAGTHKAAAAVYRTCHSSTQNVRWGNERLSLAAMNITPSMQRCARAKGEGVVQGGGPLDA